ncbi:MAG: hypothetical protein HZB15_12865, partial [Actinobacteria bacterium]|nr:hypothetical protein [Actinomycetota bacterium]
MRPLPTAAAVTVTVALAIAALVRGLRPRGRSLADVRALLYPTEPSGAEAALGRGASTVSGVAAPLARWIERAHGDGLRFIEMSASDLAVRLVLGVVGGTLAMGCIVTSLLTMGALPPSPVWLGVSVAV